LSKSFIILIQREQIKLFFAENKVLVEMLTFTSLAVNSSELIFLSGFKIKFFVKVGIVYNLEFEPFCEKQLMKK
jgi:hypothetical protein